MRKTAELEGKKQSCSTASSLGTLPAEKIPCADAVNDIVRPKKARRQSSEEERSKKKKKKDKKKKKKKERGSGSDGQLKKLEWLRAERLRRERAERARTDHMLQALSCDAGVPTAPSRDAPVTLEDERRRGYNSAFNPELSRFNRRR